MLNQAVPNTRHGLFKFYGMALSCYDTIIGITRGRCDCYPELPEGYDTSDSGLYLDDIDGIKMLNGLASDCQGTVWNLAFEERKRAILQFIADSNAMLSSRFKARRDPFQGTIGAAAGKTPITLSSNYFGIQLACAPIRSGLMRISEIGCAFQNSGVVTFYLYNNLNELLYTQAVTVTGGAHSKQAVNWSLPLRIEYTDATQYFLVCEYDSSNKPLANTFDCGCGGTNMRYNSVKPLWASSWKGSRAWANWVMLSDWSGDTLDNFNNTYATGGSLNANGITLKAAFTCDVSDTICPTTGLDFDNSPLARTIALCIYWQSGIGIVNRVLASESVARSVQTNREELAKQRDMWTQKYIEALKYVVSEVSDDASDCLMCKPKFELKTGLIGA